MSGRSGWFAAQGHIVGSLENWTTEYTWTGETYLTQDGAVEAGFEDFGSDDFNVGRIKDGVLVWWGWMNDPHPPEDYAEVTSALGLRSSKSAS